ncbi:glutathione S-transferase family protein [Parasphingorhabdus cellanae]|uniref:glutathione transferase n=1 Tax=Parasphingorhabdus cellanae TaxID=2806553 RepID=A0ABX7TA36_9SPHN|nr:glutathione S-transferase family protein [Parasphingorhabdus cellanae]QTD57222.1 glutathione S-transferase family protein [Parasphingorhabdus cellanae]
MTDPVIVHGYRFSVYNQIVRMALQQKNVTYSSVEIDPFADTVPESYLEMHPFGRVPSLVHGDFQIYETAAITRYIDQAFDGMSLVPAGAKQAARMMQVISIIDNYGYWPMVRQVASQRVFAPLYGQASDEAEVAKGLQESRVVLTTLNKIAREGLVLNCQQVTLADCHLAPMVGYFVQVSEGEKEFEEHQALNRWWSWISCQQSFQTTRPPLPSQH